MNSHGPIVRSRMVCGWLGPLHSQRPTSNTLKDMELFVRSAYDTKSSTLHRSTCDRFARGTTQRGMPMIGVRSAYATKSSTRHRNTCDRFARGTTQRRMQHMGVRLAYATKSPTRHRTTYDRSARGPTQRRVPNNGVRPAYATESSTRHRNTCDRFALGTLQRRMQSMGVRLAYATVSASRGRTMEHSDSLHENNKLWRTLDVRYSKCEAGIRAVYRTCRNHCFRCAKCQSTSSKRK